MSPSLAKDAAISLVVAFLLYLLIVIVASVVGFVVYCSSFAAFDKYSEVYAWTIDLPAKLYAVATGQSGEESYTVGGILSYSVYTLAFFVPTFFFVRRSRESRGVFR